MKLFQLINSLDPEISPERRKILGLGNHSIRRNEWTLTK